MFLTTPFSIQNTGATGNALALTALGPKPPVPLQGSDEYSLLNGSVRNVTQSGNTFSPSRVPPPFLLRKLRPSSAARAWNPMNPRIWTRSPTAVGSSTTVYLPGSNRLGLFHFRHFSIAALPIAAPSISSMRTAGCEAQPELDPSEARTVVESRESVARP